MKNILLSVFILVNFLSCKPDPERIPDKHNYYYLTAEQLAKTPYFTNPDFDTLTYVSNQNDTVVFAKTKVESSWYKLSNYDMGRDYAIHNYYLQLTAKYQTIKGEGSFEVVQELRIGSSFKISFNNNIFIPTDDHIGWSGFPTFMKEFDIDNIKYKNVIIIYSTFGDSTTNEGYINQSHGLFYFNNKINNQKYLLN